MQLPVESNLNQKCTIKHLRITVMEFTYDGGCGLPRCRRRRWWFFLWTIHDQSIIPIRCKMLIRMDDELFVASLLDSIYFSSKHHNPLDYLYVLWKEKNNDQVSINYYLYFNLLISVKLFQLFRNFFNWYNYTRDL